MTAPKYFHAEQPNAPSLTGAQGSFINLLDACLVTGFGLAAVDSIVVTGGIAVATISIGHSLQPDMYAMVAGATPSGLNGEKRVLATTNTTVTFDATGISNQTATGTLSIKVASLGWEKVYSGTNKAVYRPTHVEGTRMYLRVDDGVGGQQARIWGYESMSDIDTGLRPFPTSDALPAGMFIPKADDTTTEARDWTIIGDHRTVYFHTNPIKPTSFPTTFRMAGVVHGFGDFKSFKSSDHYACFITADGTGRHTSSGVGTGSIEYVRTDADPGTWSFLPRNYTAVSGISPFSKMAESLHNTNGDISGTVAQFGYPNGPDQGLLLTSIVVVEKLTGVPHLRGRMRGVQYALQNCHNAFTQRSKIEGSGALTGRTLLAVKCGSARLAGSAGVLFFDITGPWES